MSKKERNKKYVIFYEENNFGDEQFESFNLEIAKKEFEHLKYVLPKHFYGKAERILRLVGLDENDEEYFEIIDEIEF